jgi:hypothetical protein
MFAELFGAHIQGGSGLTESTCEFSNNGIYQPRFGGTGQRLGLLDRVVDNFRDATVVPVFGGFDQLEPGDEQYCTGRETRRMGDMPAKRSVDSAKMANDSEYQMLTARAFGASERTRQCIKQRVDSFTAFQPPRDELRSLNPGTSSRCRLRFTSGSSAHALFGPVVTVLVSGPLTRGLTRLDIVRSTLPFRPSLTQP